MQIGGVEFGNKFISMLEFHGGEPGQFFVGVFVT